jgi:hypothetical protein
MTTTFTWSITQVRREIADGYVFQVEYLATAAEGGLASSWVGSVDLPRPEGEMISFYALTEDLMLDWVQQQLGEDGVNKVLSTLQAGIDQQKVVTVATGLPWLMEAPDTVMVRARDELGQYIGDDPVTPENEAYVEVPLSEA